MSRTEIDAKGNGKPAERAKPDPAAAAADRAAATAAEQFDPNVDSSKLAADKQLADAMKEGRNEAAEAELEHKRAEEQRKTDELVQARKDEADLKSAGDVHAEQVRAEQDHSAANAQAENSEFSKFLADVHADSQDKARELSESRAAVLDIEPSPSRADVGNWLRAMGGVIRFTDGKREMSFPHVVVAAWQFNEIGEKFTLTEPIEINGSRITHAEEIKEFELWSSDKDDAVLLRKCPAGGPILVAPGTKMAFASGSLAF